MRTELVALGRIELDSMAQESERDPFKLAVQLPMVGSRADVQVLGQVVRFAAVDVVDDLIGRKSATQGLFGDEDVFTDVGVGSVAISDQDADVTIWPDTATTAPRGMVGLSAVSLADRVSAPSPAVVLEGLVPHPQRFRDGTETLASADAPLDLFAVRWNDR